jgi:hypothetical protein
MKNYIQLNSDNMVVGSVSSLTPPIHANQYEVEDATVLVGKVYSNGSFYPPKIVADTAQSGIAVTLGNKVTG